MERSALRRQKRQRAQSLLPVTIAELLNATQNEDKFYTGDIEISQITMVGLVRSVKESPTRLDYEIDDMTGPPLEVKQFVDNDGMNMTTDAGSMKTMGGGHDFSSGMNGGDTVIGLSPIQNQVHLIVKGTMTEQGASIDNICQQLRGVPEKAISTISYR
ncbi:hypothetical protein KUTeg_016762 [Tegillarca granosa]|uniref:Uncharacterized protein n=1 Tax=Tegillarca granosa TaxID=220873 RepID=A0ABQ9ELT9_TEGGR|nr:hypothetical protein KUTeg_016762 [Tegillarca granosa]